MTRCVKCGAVLKNDIVYCQNCGAAYKVSQEPFQLKTETGNKLWLLVGIAIPIIGFILYLAWRKSKPKSSYYAGIGALFGYTAWIILRYAALLFFSSPIPYVLMF